MSLVNNYIIGLGGTGGEAVAAFRRATVLRHPEFEQLQQEGARFEYLYIDSITNEIHKAGDEISLSPYTLNGRNDFTKEDAKNHPRIAPWLGDIDRMQHNVFDFHLSGAGGIRRYGRMLFARKADEISAKLTQGISSLLHGSTDSHSITFHIFASLGGGTGSGCLIDTITLVHELTPPGRRAEVMLYLFVGGEKIEGSPGGGWYFYPNEYCTLRDLNALMSNRYNPVIAGDPNNNTGRTFVGGDPITTVHISSDASHLAPNLEQQVEDTANACFDTISLIHSDIYGPVEEAFIGEDIHRAYPGECSNTDNPEKVQQVPPTDGFPERSYRFQTVGVSRCKEPVMEIRTILKDEFAAQVNNLRLKGELSHRDFGRCSAQNRENDDIYDGTAILPGSPLAVRCDQYDMEKLEAYEMAFHAADLKLTPESLINVNTYVQETVRAIEEETMKDLCSSEWQELCHDAARERMKPLTQKLEQRSRWSGEHPHSEPIWGATDIAHYLRSLMDRLCKPYVKFTTSLGNMEKREKVWHTIGALTKLLCSKKERDFELHLKEGRAVIARALAKRREALSATVEKCMIGHSESLCALIERNIVILESEIRRHRAAAEAQIQQLRAIVPNVQLVFNERHLMKHVEYLRSAAAERELERSLATFESCNTTNAPFEHLLPHPESDNLGSASPTYWTESMRLHDELLQSHPLDYKAAFHTSIYEALEDLRDNSPAEYNQKLESLCHNVNPLASIDPVPSGGPGLQTHTSAPVRAVLVGLPDIKGSSPEQEETKQAVIKYIEGETKGLASAPHRFKRCYHTNKHEVRILCLDYWMPVRYFSFFRYLQRKMDEVLLSANKEIKRTTVLYYANIDDRDDEKPSLIPPEPIRHNAEFSDTNRPAAPQA